MRKKTVKNYARALYEITKDLRSGELDKIIEKFILILAKDGKLGRVDEIVEEYLAYEKEMSGIKSIEVVSSTDISKSMSRWIKDYFGGEIEINKKIDAEILGGFKIRFKDKVLDASVKTQLLKLKKSLM